MPSPELEAFEDECAAVDETLAAVPDDAWHRPALGEWDVAALVAHLVRAVTRVDAYLDVAVDATEPEADRVDYFREPFDAAGIAQRARDRAAEATPTQLVAAFADGWRATAARVGGLPPERLIATPRGPMRLDEYLATRVLEVVVHHIDLRAALDLPPDSTVAAARMTLHLLEDLLGSPRPRNLGRTRFILAATGRVDVDDPRFPVLT